MADKGKGLKITAAALIGAAVGTFLVVGFRARGRGYSNSKMIARSFNLPHVPRGEDPEEVIASAMTDEELIDTFR